MASASPKPAIDLSLCIAGRHIQSFQKIIARERVGHFHEQKLRTPMEANECGLTPAGGDGHQYGSLAIFVGPG